MSRHRGRLRVVHFLLGCAAACGPDGGPSGAGQLRATVAAPGQDTVRFAAPGLARRCAAGRGLVLEGLDEGSGLLVWLRPGDSALVGEYGFAAPGDTTRQRRVTVGVRYPWGATAHGVTLDSGHVTVLEADDRLTVQVHGTGLVLPMAVRATVEAGFERVRVGADSASCEPEGS